MRGMRTLSLVLLALLLLLSSVRSADPIADEYESDEPATHGAPSPVPLSATGIPVTVQSVPANAADEYDEDEFIVEKKAPEPPKITVLGSPDSELKPDQPLAPSAPRTYWMEAFFVTIIIIYGINYWLGRKANADIASRWALAHRDLLFQNFSKVGDQAILIRQTVYRFRLKATGRRYVRGLQAVLELVRRHDAFSLFLRLFNISSQPDMVTIDVPMKEQDPFVFAILKRKIEADFKSDNPEVADFCSTGSGGFDVPASFVVYSEHAELLSQLFLTCNLAKILDEYENDIHAIYISDTCLTSNYRKTLRVIYRLQPKNIARSVELFKFVLSLIDAVADTRLSKQAQERSEKRRRKLLEIADKKSYAQRQEELQKKKMEEYAKLSPEEKAKRDEKEARKAQKKKMKYKVQMA